MKPLDYAVLKQKLTKRKHTAHKGDFGHVLIIGGYYGMGGAVRMAGEAALRTGAGLVTIVTRPEHVSGIVAARPELMCHGVKNSDGLRSLVIRATVIVIGPGLGQSTWSRQMLRVVLQQKLPLVIDADALNLLAKKPKLNSNWILTPHPGEAARLLSNKVEHDRVLTVKTMQKKYGGVCVLKGAGTLVADEEGLVGICTAGNPGMATAGMGDVLSGIIGGLLAQKLSLSDAAKLGVCIHAMAGDLVAKEFGERGMLALDLMPYVRKLIN